MPPRRPRYSLLDLLMVVTLSGLFFALAWWVWQLANRARTLSPDGDNSFGTFIALEFAVLACSITWGVSRALRKAPECVECGRKSIQPRKSIGPALCHRCRQRALSPAGLKKEKSRGLRTVFLFMAISAIVVGFVLSDFVAARFERSYWVALPLVAIGASLGLFGGLLFGLAVFLLIRNRIFRGGPHALTRARKMAGEEGEASIAGPIKLWYSGSTDPTTMLMEQSETVRGRFAAMVGEAIEVRAPLRIFCFDRQDAFVKFHRQTATYLWNYDGIYMTSPARMLTLSTEIVRHRSCDAEETARSLFALAFLDDFKGFLLVPWLQTGINHALTAGGEGLDRLNRKVVVSIGKGTALGEDLFRFKPTAYMQLLKNWPVHEDHARLRQFIAQSWSLVEYLGGEEAPEDRRARFRAYLKAIRRGKLDEAIFPRHFGQTHDQLLESWRVWVLERGVGMHGAPSIQIQDALTRRLIPTIQDNQARIIDRILAIRALGSMGYALGADRLIDLLRNGGEIPKEEVVWSLEMISGMAWGDDLDRYSEWWAGLPESIREVHTHRTEIAAS